MSSMNIGTCVEHYIVSINLELLHKMSRTQNTAAMVVDVTKEMVISNQDVDYIDLMGNTHRNLATSTLSFTRIIV